MLASGSQLDVLRAAEQADRLPGSVLKQQSALPLTLPFLQFGSIRERIPAVRPCRRIPGLESVQCESHLECFQVVLFQPEERISD